MYKIVKKNPLIAACRKIAVRHPNVRVLNCSVSMPYTGVRTYYSRMYEGKFITGAIAGEMCIRDRADAGVDDGYAHALAQISQVPGLIGPYRRAGRLHVGLQPVSYTHLDVYKRQEHDIALLLIGVIAARLDIDHRHALFDWGKVGRIGDVPRDIASHFFY